MGPATLTLTGATTGTERTVALNVKATPTITATPTPASVPVNGGTSHVAVTVTSPAAGGRDRAR